MKCNRNYKKNYNAEINNIRIKAYCGADGLLIDSLFNQINSISIDWRYPRKRFKILRNFSKI